LKGEFIHCKLRHGQTKKKVGESRSRQDTAGGGGRSSSQTSGQEDKGPTGRKRSSMSGNSKREELLEVAPIPGKKKKIPGRGVPEIRKITGTSSTGPQVFGKNGSGTTSAKERESRSSRTQAEQPDIYQLSPRKGDQLNYVKKKGKTQGGFRKVGRCWEESVCPIQSSPHQEKEGEGKDTEKGGGKLRVSQRNARRAVLPRCRQERGTANPEENGIE